MQPVTPNNVDRKRDRYYKREMKAAAYRAVALSGGGAREVARRANSTLCRRMRSRAMANS